ncbi:hypothetical protein AVU67_gp13 [Ralstonia phage RSJ2]|uniref:Uncharacterized protein n=1 Tax=Ralstonia phage RSJ2 TaxID=1481785 RepID=A0A068Q7T7_9CAUD|nr:hypothetical protein AVU67_gp13 [Ralstonia phage RSJ2]BAP15819.1 hypothetical protein [Ralstonia phage RSJ2]
MAKTLIEQLTAVESQIKTLETKRDELAAKIEAEQALSNVAAGTTIVFNYGRAETRKELTGVVKGVADTDKGRRIKVESGEGFDATIYVIEPAAVVRVA